MNRLLFFLFLMQYVFDYVGEYYDEKVAFNTESQVGYYRDYTKIYVSKGDVNAYWLALEKDNNKKILKLGNHKSKL